MSDWTKDLVEIAPYACLTTVDENSQITPAAGALGSTFITPQAWQAVNLALYVPVLIRVPTTVYQMAWINGATLGGNVDVGIIDGSSKARLISTGSTAQAGASALQVVDVADTLIPVGLHYLAMSLNSNTATVIRGSLSTAIMARANGVAQQAAGFPIPNPVTFEVVAVTSVPFVIAAIQSGVF